MTIMTNNGRSKLARTEPMLLALHVVIYIAECVSPMNGKVLWVPRLSK